MKKNILSLIMLFAVLSSSVINGQTKPTCNQKKNYTDNLEKMSNLSVNLELLSSNEKEFVFRVIVTNESDESLYIMTDPVQSNNQENPYLSSSEDNKGIIIIGSLTYPPPPTCLNFYSNQAGVTLKKLLPNEVYENKFVLSVPIKSTTPPYTCSLVSRSVFSKDAIQGFIMKIGYLVDDEGVKDLQRRKPQGFYVNGLEYIPLGKESGKHIFEAQKIEQSNFVKIN